MCVVEPCLHETHLKEIFVKAQTPYIQKMDFVEPQTTHSHPEQIIEQHLLKLLQFELFRASNDVAVLPSVSATSDSVATYHI